VVIEELFDGYCWPRKGPLQQAQMLTSTFFFKTLAIIKAGCAMLARSPPPHEARLIRIQGGWAVEFPQFVLRI